MTKRALHFLTFSLGVLFLLHGIDKLINGISHIENILIGYFLPFSEYATPCTTCFTYGIGFMGKVFLTPTLPYHNYIAYIVYLSEVIAPIFLIFGKYVKIASAIISLYMLISIFLIYRNTLFNLNSEGALSVEAPVLYLMLALTIIFVRERDK